MQLAFTAFGLFATAFLIHLIWWRIRLPRHQLPTLFKWMLLFLPIGLVGMCLEGLWSIEWLFSPASVLVALLYFAMTITYVITYSALEGDSPTLSLMRWIARHPEGVTSEELEAFMASRPFIQARLKALDSDGLIEQREGLLFIKGKPSLFFRVVLGWRSLYGPIEQGG